jgi:tRNA 2-selenouridine synthase
MPAAGRVRHLMAEYRHLIAEPQRFKEILGRLEARRGAKQLAEWFALIDAGEWEAVVGRLLAEHYDPGYATSFRRCFPNVTEVRELADTSDGRVEELVEGLLTYDNDRPREYAGRALPRA